MKPRPLALFAPLLTLSLAVSAQQSQPASTAEDASFNTEQWLNGPDRRDIPWQVKVWPPILTFQQRYLVIFFGSLDLDDLRKKEVRDFTIQIKVQCGSGQWLSGEDTSNYEVRLSAPPRTDVTFFSAVYALPGEYRVAILLYDGLHRKINVRHQRVRVPDVKGNALPHLTRGFPEIEFPSRMPGMNKDQAPIKDPGWSPAEGPENLPIPALRPLLIDVLLDVSEPDAMLLPWHMRATDRQLAAQFRYYENAKLMVQLGSVLSHLQPAQGCVRLSAADMSRMHVVLDRQSASKWNWKQFEDSLYAVDLDRVDAKTLSIQQGRSVFTDQFLVDLANDTTPCEAGGPAPDHVVILVSHHLRYPRHTPVTPIQPADCPHCRFVYLRLTYFLDEREDRYQDMLRLLHPRSFRFSTPRDFRKVLAQLTQELSDTHAAN